MFNFKNNSYSICWNDQYNQGQKSLLNINNHVFNKNRHCSYLYGVTKSFWVSKQISGSI